MAWLLFFISAILVFLAGSRLIASADVIARETGLGGLWVGMIILPFSTSLPELAASWRSVSIGAPDLAVGNFLGSNLFNFGIIALIDLVQGKGTIFKLISKKHIVPVIFIAIMTLLVIAGMLLPAMPFALSPITPLLFIAYLVAGYFFLRDGGKKKGRAPKKKTRELKSAILTFCISSLIIIIAAISLADAAENLAQVTGLGRTFVGTLLMAMSTSLPEMVTTTTAVRMGALDMAVGNVLGANLFNLALLLPVDLFYRQDSLLSHLSPLHFVTAIMGLVLAALVYLGLTRPSRVVLGDVGINSLFILVGYIASIVILFLLGGQF